MDVELIGIHKSFGPVHANDDITLKIPAGTIQGILGENGAGKSTLMKVLSGFIHADKGQIVLNGSLIQIDSPADAIHQGIGMLHQDPLDFPPMKVIDNFIIGSGTTQPFKNIFPNHNQIAKQFGELQKEFDFVIDADAYVETLTVGERQQLEILRLLWLGASVLILDEPTTGISAPQKVKLFATLKRLASQGKTIIFVSHKLEDVEELCDQVAVLRSGKLVGETEKPFRVEVLVQMMFGKPVSLAEREKSKVGAPVLEISDLSLESPRLQVHDINLKIGAGEVIGLAGMEGSGQLMFLRACAGLIRPVAGKISIHGQDLTGKKYHTMMGAGVTYVPAARLEEGLVHGLTLTDHFALAGEQKGIFIDRQAVATETEKQIQEYNIKGRPKSVIEDLSGGNQQRALLALLQEQRSVILMEHPTRGLDIESAIWVWGKLKERCRQGTVIVFISADLEEIMHYSDRIMVFFSGQATPSIPVSETDVEQLGQLIGGKGLDQIL